MLVELSLIESLYGWKVDEKTVSEKVRLSIAESRSIENETRTGSVTSCMKYAALRASVKGISTSWLPAISRIRLRVVERYVDSLLVAMLVKRFNSFKSKLLMFISMT